MEVRAQARQRTGASSTSTYRGLVGLRVSSSEAALRAAVRVVGRDAGATRPGCGRTISRARRAGGGVGGDARISVLKIGASRAVWVRPSGPVAFGNQPTVAAAPAPAEPTERLSLDVQCRREATWYAAGSSPDLVQLRRSPTYRRLVRMAIIAGPLCHRTFTRLRFSSPVAGTTHQPAAARTGPRPGTVLAGATGGPGRLLDRAGSRRAGEPACDFGARRRRVSS